MENNFTIIYENLKPELSQLETKRLELKAKGIRSGLIVGSICSLAGSIFAVCIDAGNVGIPIACALGGVILYSCINSKSKELSVYYKQNIISPIITSLCEGAIFHPDEGITTNQFMASGLFQTTPDRYHSKDLITGRIDNRLCLCRDYC